MTEPVMLCICMVFLNCSWRIQTMHGIKGHLPRPICAESLLSVVPRKHRRRKQVQKHSGRPSPQSCTVMFWNLARCHQDAHTPHKKTLPTLWMLNYHRGKGCPIRNLVETCLLPKTHRKSQKQGLRKREGPVPGMVSPVAQASTSHKTKMSPHPKALNRQPRPHPVPGNTTA